MSNFLFSINATFPLIIIVSFGMLLKKSGMLDDSFASQCDRLVFKVTLPLSLFLNMYSVDIRSRFDGQFVGFCAAVTVISILGILAGAFAFLKDSREEAGEFVQASYRGSIAILGNALLSNIYGSAAMSPLMILGSVPLYNIAACLILAWFAPAPAQDGVSSFSRVRPGKVFGDVLTNPIILGILAGALFSFTGIRLPVFLESAARSLGALTTPLALLSIGIGFKGKKALGKLPVSGTAALLKLVLIPAVFVPAAIWMGFRGEALIAILIMLGSPTTPSGYTMARIYGYQGVISASTVVLTTLGSAVTITAAILILRTLGLV